MGAFLTDSACITQRKYVNLPAWDKYDGSGISVFHDDAGDKNHIGNCKDIIQTLLTKAKVYSGTINYIQDGQNITQCNISCIETKETLSFDNFITKYNISLINNSTTGGSGEEILPIALYMKEKITKYNLIMCGSAGNENSQPTNQKYNGACIMVTGCHLNNKGVPVFSNYCIGKNIDFAMFTGFQAGTSFASPFLLGMAGKLRGRNPNITQEQVKAYFKAHCKDILATGFDIQSGWGIPIMGNTKTTIELQIGNNIMKVDGVEYALDQPPVIMNGRTMIPLRSPMEAFGADVNWDQNSKKITITHE